MKDPSSYRDAIGRTDGEKWQKAIATELDNLKRNKVFVEVPRPRDLGKRLDTDMSSRIRRMDILISIKRDWLRKVTRKSQ